MKIAINLIYFGALVLLAALLMLWRRADDWNGVPFPKRFVLAISASRYWWLAYSFAFLFWWMTRGWTSFRDGFPVVLVAVVMAAFFTFTRNSR
jgi:hypothetical protein